MPKSAATREILVRLIVRDPPPGAHWAVQLGREALLPPVSATTERVVFEVPLTLVSGPDGALVVRGAAAQGPPAGRFLYVNSGTRAGAGGSPWNRRAKVPLAGVAALGATLAAGATGPVMEAEMAGCARDGGPACASIVLQRAWEMVPRGARALDGG